MRRALLAAVITLGGCASTTPGSALPGREEGRLTDASRNALRIRPGDGAVRATLNAPLASVWRVLPAVFDSLEIPANTLDPAIYVFGNSGFRVTKRLGKTPLGQIIDCGQTQGFPSAETYEVNLAVMTQLHQGPDTGTTILAATVDASARPQTYRAEFTRCSSKAELEKRIAYQIRAEVKRKP